MSSTITGISLNSAHWRRRPGAAGSRLAKAREAEKSALHKIGWHESIQAAAASANREWEPKKGWIDYKSRQEGGEGFQEISDPKMTSKKIHIPLHIAAKKGNSSDSTSESCHADADATYNDTTVGFPRSWIQEQLNDNSNDKAESFPLSWEEQQIDKSKKTSKNTAVANAKKPSRTSKATGTSNRKTTTRQSLVHSKPNTQKSIDLSGPSDDPCWPHYSPRGRSDSTRPLLMERRENTGFSSPRQRNKREKNVEKQEDSNPHLGRSFPPVPPEIERLRHPPTIKHREKKVHSLSPARERGAGLGASSSHQSTPSPKPASSRWVQSMKKATARLVKDGHSWNPKHGFANLESADVVSLQPSIRSSPPTFGSQIKSQLAPSLKSPADVLEKMIAERRKNDPPGRKEFAVGASMRASTLNLYEEDNHGVQKQRSPDGVRMDDNQSSIQEQIEVVMVSNATSAHEQGNLGISALNFEEDEDYLLRAPIVVTPNVAVKKEKVSQGEFELFPKQARRNSTQFGSVVSPGDHAGSTNGKSMHAIRRARSGRGSGPIDVDEVENLSGISSETSDASNVWENGMFENDSFLQGSISPRRQGERSPRGLQTQPRHQLRPPLHQSQVALDGERWKVEQKPAANNSASQYASLLEIATRGASTQKESVNDPKPEVIPINNKSKNATSPKRTAEKPGILKTSPRQTNSEIATDDASQGSTPSSVSAGWKSFLNKKVQKESAAAAVLQRQAAHGEAKDQTKIMEQKIKKTVSWAEDSVLSDSLFDFSVSDVNPPGSPLRNQCGAGKPPLNLSGSPLRNQGFSRKAPIPRDSTRTESRTELASPQYRERIRSTNSGQSALKHFSEEEEKEPPAHVESRSGVLLDQPPRRIHQRSFGELTDVSPLTSHHEEKESIIQNEQPSFLQRLAECRAPLALHSEGGNAPAGHRQRPCGGNKEEPLAYQWYLQSKQASQRVEEMMEFLKSKRFASCSSIRPANASRVDLDHDADNSEREAHDLARARVEAMVETLYYAGRNDTP